MQLIGIATRPKTRQPVELHEQTGISITNGISGDFRSRPGSRQITVLSARQWAQACEELAMQLPWTTRRANLLIDDWIFSAKDIGKTIYIAEVELLICAETEPCKKMDQAHFGLRKALSPDYRGGVCCKVIKGGNVSCADKVDIK